MGRVIGMLALAGAVFALAAAPAFAVEYQVTKASGARAGRVVPGPDPGQGDRIGTIYDLSRFRGAVYSRQTSSGYVGWPVSNGTSYVAWVKKSSTSRFLVKKVPWGATAGRVTQLASGRWLAQKRVDGRWRTVGRIQAGCRGQWAAGAARLLLWQR